MDLFENDSLVRVASSQNTASLTKEQKAFYRYIKQIEECRGEIHNWENTVPKINSLIHNELEPLRERFVAARTQFALKLDQRYGAKGLTKTENNKLSKLISHWCQDLLMTNDAEPDPEVVAVYDKHTGGDYLQEQEEFGEQMKSLLGNMFEMDFADEPTPKSAEEMSEMMRKHMLEKILAAEQENDFDSTRPPPSEAGSKARKPSAKTLAKQAREQEDAKAMDQSLREIYRKLASSLHPDREPDEQERARKTQLMQRVNAAHDQKDLLKLLELQLEIEQISAQDIQSIASSRLKHYNKILSEQLRELKDVKEVFEMRFRNPGVYGVMKPQTVLHMIHSDIKDMGRNLKGIESDLHVTDDLSQLKSWLKSIRLQDFEEHGLFMGS
jgi:hypothetical protein